MFGIIYKATDPDGRVYVGQTVKSLSQRKGNHAYCVKKGDRRTAFHIALRTLGFSAFQWEQIDTAETKEELDAKEKQWIVHFQSDDPAYGYNGTNGGIKTVYTVETRRKMSVALKGKKKPPLTDEHRWKISEATKGRIVSEETREKKSKALMGKRLTWEHRQKLRKAYWQRILQER